MRTPKTIAELRRELERLKPKGLPLPLSETASLSEVIAALNKLLEVLR